MNIWKPVPGHKSETINCRFSIAEELAVTMTPPPGLLANSSFLALDIGGVTSVDDTHINV